MTNFDLSDHRSTELLTCLLLFASSVPLGTPCRGQQPKQPSRKAELPIRVEPVAGKDGHLRFGNENGAVLMAQTFGFDREKRVSGPAGGGVTIQLKGSPIPIVLCINGDFGGTMSPLYANTTWNLNAFPTFSIGTLFTTEGVRLCDITLTRGQAKQLHISKDYIVFPEAPGNIAKGGPFVTVTFDGKSLPKKTTLLTKRNGQIVKHDALDPSRETTLIFESVKKANDVVEWQIQDRNGKTICESVLAFPIASAAPGFVEYKVTIVPPKAKTKTRSRQ